MRVTIQSVEYVPLKELEAVLAARVGWIDAAISPFAVAARNATKVTELVKRPALPARTFPDELRPAG